MLFVVLWGVLDMSSSLINDVVDVVTRGTQWGITVCLLGTAAFLATSLVAWMIHRS